MIIMNFTIVSYYIVSLLLSFFIGFLYFDKILTPNIKLKEYLFIKQDKWTWIMFITTTIIPTFLIFSLLPTKVHPIINIVLLIILSIINYMCIHAIIKAICKLNKYKYIDEGLTDETFMNNIIQIMIDYYIIISLNNLILLGAYVLVILIVSKFKNKKSYKLLQFLSRIFFATIVVFRIFLNVYYTFIPVYLALITYIIYAISIISICFILGIAKQDLFNSRNTGFWVFNYIWYIICFILCLLYTI